MKLPNPSFSRSSLVLSAWRSFLDLLPSFTNLQQRSLCKSQRKKANELPERKISKPTPHLGCMLSLVPKHHFGNKNKLSKSQLGPLMSMSSPCKTHIFLVKIAFKKNTRIIASFKLVSPGCREPTNQTAAMFDTTILKATPMASNKPQNSKAPKDHCMLQHFYMFKA